MLLLAKRRSALTAVAGPVPPAPRHGDRQALRCAGRRRLAGEQEGHRRGPAQDARRQGERHVRPVRGRPCRRPALDHAGQGGAQVRRLHAARRDPEDRPHAPDPRAPGQRGPSDRRRPEVRRLRAEPRRWRAASTASRACSCTPGNWHSTTRPAASASAGAPLPARVRDTARRTYEHCAPLRPHRLRLGRHPVRFDRADRALHPGRLPRPRRGRAQRRRRGLRHRPGPARCAAPRRAGPAGRALPRTRLCATAAITLRASTNCRCFPARWRCCRR